MLPAGPKLANRAAVVIRSLRVRMDTGRAVCAVGVLALQAWPNTALAPTLSDIDRGIRPRRSVVLVADATALTAE
jgi:hypothetical protein